MDDIIKAFKMIKGNLSLDEKLYIIYNNLFSGQSFEICKKRILSALNIDEYNYYTKNVDTKLVRYIEDNIFPEYENNDQGHGILHIREVIRRAFALNETFKLNLDKNIIFTIASCHDLGKYIDHKTHHLIAANIFYKNDEFKNFFTEEQRLTIKEAIEDHRSSKEDEPRTTYGKLISSADRNTTIKIVFIRSFYVALERTPDMDIDDYLEFTLNRLRKKYDEQNPENMFYEDMVYSLFLNDMRELLSKPNLFKEEYCKINLIDDRTLTVKESHNIRDINKFFAGKI